MGEADGVREGVADLVEALAHEPNDVTCEGLLDGVALLRDDALGAGKADLLPESPVVHLQVRRVAPGADPHEGHAVAVARVHVGLDLEDEGAEGLAGLAHHLAAGVFIHHAPRRRRRELDEGVEERLEPEVGQRRAEEGGGDLSLQEPVDIHLVAGDLEQLQLLPDPRGLLCAEALLGDGGIKGDPLDVRLLAAARGGLLEEHELSGAPVDNAPEVAPGAHGPVHGGALDPERLFHLGHEFEGVAARQVELVDEGEDRDPAQAADLKELPGLGLDALARVQDHDGRVRSGQRPERVLAEVLVTWGIQDVDDVPAVLELHGRGGDRDPSRLLHAHPVGGGELALAVLDEPGGLHDAGIKEQLLREGRLARVGVRDDRESAPAGDFPGDPGVCGHACVGVGAPLAARGAPWSIRQGRLLGPLTADYHTTMRRRSCTSLTVLLLAIFAFLAGPEIGAGSSGSFDEESERVEEVSTEEMTVVRSDPERVRSWVWTSELDPPVDGTVRPRLQVRVPRAPGCFLLPLRC